MQFHVSPAQCLWSSWMRSLRPPEVTTFRDSRKWATASAGVFLRSVVGVAGSAWTCMGAGYHVKIRPIITLNGLVRGNGASVLGRLRVDASATELKSQTRQR